MTNLRGLKLLSLPTPAKKQYLLVVAAAAAVTCYVLTNANNTK